MTRSPEEYVNIARNPERYPQEAVEDALVFWTRISNAVKAPIERSLVDNDNEVVPT